MDAKSCYCTRKNCPRNKIQILDDESSQKSSERNYEDKETQKTPEMSSGNQTIQSTATSETNFDRNNENLSTPPETSSCPTIAKQPNSSPHLSAKINNKPAFNVICQCGPSLPESEEYTWIFHTNPPPEEESSSQRCSAGSESTCENATVSSSSSTTSDHYPLRLILNSKYVANDTLRICPQHTQAIDVSGLVPKPKRLQPNQEISTTNPNENSQYYSCSSASSGRDFSDTPSNHRYQNILNLLHQMVHLFTDAIKAKKDMRTFNDPKSSQKKSPTLSAMGNSMELKSNCDVLLRNHKDNVKPCNPCSQLREFLDKYKDKSSESQSPRTDDSSCKDVKPDLIMTPRMRATNSNTVEDNDCGCSKNQTAMETTPHHNSITSPWQHHHCCCQYLAALAAANGLALPLPSPANQLLMFPPTYLGGPITPITNDANACICNSIESPMENPEEEKQKNQIEKSKLNYNENSGGELQEVMMDISENDQWMNNNNDLVFVDKGDDVEEKEIETNLNSKLDEDKSINNYQMDQSHADAFDLNPLRNNIEYIEEELYSRVRDIKTLEQLEEMKRYTETIFANLAEETSGRLHMPEDLSPRVDEYYQEDSIANEPLDSDYELEKEEMAERYKNRSHKEPCDCCQCQEKLHSGEKTCSTLAESRQQGPPTRLENFKYFIDSIEMDLEAMEHARCKNHLIQNICQPKPKVCSRKSFPVTILDVQELGSSSLYVKWIIHDCYGIAGYELFVDGHLSNRFYHSRHESAVICNVDITKFHKIALVAQPISMSDESLALFCKSPKAKSKCKSLPWKANIDANTYLRSGENPSNLWTPSIYLYDPAENHPIK